MMSLERLALADLRNQVNSYRNLFYHRNVILEGIRKTAFRNMAHLTEAMERSPSLSDLGGDDWIALVQRRMLHDQGMDDTPLNRTLIGPATYFPLQVLLALLYAEVEFYRQWCQGRPILDDSGFSAYLDSREEFIEGLRGFRDFSLHPSMDNAPAELGFLSVRHSYNLAPEIQAKLDEYLHDLRGRLLDELRGLLSELPEVQQLYCLSRFWPRNLARMMEHRDQLGQEHVQRQMSQLRERLDQIGDEAACWSPSPVQEEKAAFVAACLNEVSPSLPEQTYTNLPPRQTPTSTLALGSLTVGNAPRSYGAGRYASHVQSNIGEVRRIIIAAGILLNELVTGWGKRTPEQLRELASTMSESELADLVYDELFLQGLQHADERVALSRVTAALLHEPLRLYSEVVKENPGISRSGLDELTASGALAILRGHRNAVFHVYKPQWDPLQADVAVVRSSLLEAVHRLHPELSAFFGIPSEELSNLG